MVNINKLLLTIYYIMYVVYVNFKIYYILFLIINILLTMIKGSNYTQSFI